MGPLFFGPIFMSLYFYVPIVYGPMVFYSYVFYGYGFWVHGFLGICFLWTWLLVITLVAPVHANSCQRFHAFSNGSGLAQLSLAWLS
jgi:hypothetical protein